MASSTTEAGTAPAPDPGGWIHVRTANEVLELSHDQHLIGVHADSRSVSLTERRGAMGAVRIVERVYGSAVSIDCGQERPTYDVIVPLAGCMDSVHRNASIVAGPGSAAVYQPSGASTVRQWTAHSRRLAVQIDRCALEDALAEALGRQVTAPIDFASSMLTSTGAARAWVDMVRTLGEQLFRPDGLLRQPMVGLPFVESLLRGLLVAADHPDRAAVLAGPGGGAG